MLTLAGSDHQQALKLITSAIQLDPNQTVFWSNRAAIRMKLEEYGGAIVDCGECCSLRRQKGAVGKRCGGMRVRGR